MNFQLFKRKFLIFSCYDLIFSCPEKDRKMTNRYPCVQVGEHEEKELKASEELAGLRFEVMDSQNDTSDAYTE